MKVKLINVRLSFADLFQARAFGNDPDATPKFAGTFLLEPGSENEKLVRAAIQTAATEKWGAKAADTLKALTKADKVALKDGDTKEYDGYAGMLFIKAASEKRPRVLDADKTPLTQEDGRPYSGCYVDAIIEIYAQDNSWGKRINASLGGVQFRRHGEAFGGGAPISDDEFESIPEDGSESLV